MNNNVMETDEVQRGSSSLAFKAGFWYVFGNFVGKAITFLTTPIFARLMTTSDYGEFTNFASWVVILTIIFGAELYNTLSRAYYDFRENYDDYISTVTVLGCSITIIAYIFFLLCHEIVLRVVIIQEKYVHLLFVFLLLSFCKLMYYARERTLYRYKSVAIITFISLFFPTIISVFLVFFLPESSHLSARLYGYYGTSSLISIFCVVSLFRKSRVFEWRFCKYALVLSMPLLMHYLTAQLLTSTNVIITKNVIGVESAAVMSIANSTTHIFTIFSQAASGALTTWLMDNLEMGRIERIKQGTIEYLFLLAFITVMVIIYAPEVIYILGGNRYVGSSVLLPGLMFAAFIQSVTSVFTIILTYDKNVFKTAVITGVFSLLSVVAKVLLLPGNGLLVLAYVNIAVFSVLLIINYVLVKNAGYCAVIHVKGIVFVITIVGVVAALVPNFYEMSFSRYISSLIMCVGCILVGLSLNKKLFGGLFLVVKKLKQKLN